MSSHPHRRPSPGPGTSRSAQTRVLLDTNIWSRLGDEGVTVAALDRCLADAGCRLVQAPSMLIEALQNPDDEARDRIVRGMVMARGDRLRTEADRQGDEVIAEVRRLHPEWLRQVPPVHTTASHRRFWTTTVWKQATRKPEAFQAHYEANTEPIVQRLFDIQDAAKDEFRANVPEKTLTLLESWSTVAEGADSPLPGWDGQRAETWRVAVAILMRHELHVVHSLSQAGYTRPSTYADWIGAHVDLRAMYADEALTTRFFLEEVALINMPRLWLTAFAVETCQLYYKINHGNAQDQQHAAYLLDCDVFLTVDNRYSMCLELVRKRAPFPMAETRRVSGNKGVPIMDRVRAGLASAQPLPPAKPDL